MLFLTLTRLASQKFRLVATSASIVLGIAFLSGSMVLLDTLGASFDTLVEDINEGVDVVVRSGDTIESGFVETRGRLDESLLEVIAAVDGVEAVEPSVEGFAQLVDAEGDAVGNPANGAPTIGLAWIPTDSLNQMTLVDGAAPTSPYEVVLDRFTADSNGFLVGDQVTVLLAVPPEQFVVSGIAVFGESDSLMGASLTMFEMPTAQRVLGSPGEVNSFVVAAEAGVDQAVLQEQIARVMPDGVEVLTGQQSVAEAQGDIADALGFFSTFMTVFALIALFVAAFIIYNTFSIIVAQRTKETALLRALGAGRRQVISAVLIEALVVGLAASAVGIALGIGVAEALKALLAQIGFDIPTSGVVFEASTVYNGLIAGVGITILSSIIPAVRASSTSPLEAMREAAVDDSALSRARLAFGSMTLSLGLAALFVGLFVDVSSRLTVVGLGAAAIFVGVAGLGPILARPFASIVGTPIARMRGLPGELARENSSRNPRRTATSAAALMVGVGLVSAITIFAASTTRSVEKIIDGSVIGDLVVDSGSQGFGGLSPELAVELSELEEVEVASGVRIALAEFDGEDETILAFDTSVMERLTDVHVVSGAVAELSSTELAVLDTEAEDRGWSLGSAVEVFFVDTDVQEFTVGAIYSEDQLVGPIFMSNEAYEANSVGVFDIAIYILSNDTFPIETVRAAVESVTIDYPNASVMDLTELKDSINDQVDQMLSLVYALLALAIVIALLGISNTLSLSIVERTREIGLVRALGMTRAQLRASIRWESFLVALLGAAMGLMVGTFFGWAMGEALKSEGITELAIPPVQIAVVVLIATLAGVLASVRPAWRAAKMPILDAIST